MTISFEGRVAIVTGAGGGLGKQHALELGRRGAKVVVNDLGGSVDGSGGSASAAELVAQEIVDNGGCAIANGASVTDLDAVQDLFKARLPNGDVLTSQLTTRAFCETRHLPSWSLKTGTQSLMYI